MFSEYIDDDREWWLNMNKNYTRSKEVEREDDGKDEKKVFYKN